MSDYEVIRNHIKQGELIDIFGVSGARCISGMNEPVYLIKGQEGLRAFLNLADKVYEDKWVKKSYTFAQAQQALDRVLVSELRTTGITEKKIVELARISLPVEEKTDTYTIYRNIHGVKITRFRSLGPFKFYLGRSVQRHFPKEHSALNSWEHLAEFVVTCTVSSVTKERALELADGYFDSLELLFQFLLGRKNSGFEVRILQPSRATFLFHALKSESGQYQYGVRNNRAHGMLDLSEKIFSDKAVRRLFTLIGSEPESKMDRKLRNAVIWIAKGLASVTPIESIMNYCSAMEALLVQDELSVLSPSIMASLSEFAAFLLSNSCNDRRLIASQVKKIYKARSAGTHGGKLVADVKTEAEALQISRSLVFSILRLYPRTVKNPSELFTYVELAKYG